MNIPLEKQRNPCPHGANIMWVQSNKKWIQGFNVDKCYGKKIRNIGSNGEVAILILLSVSSSRI